MDWNVRQHPAQHRLRHRAQVSIAVLLLRAVLGSSIILPADHYELSSQFGEKLLQTTPDLIHLTTTATDINPTPTKTVQFCFPTVERERQKVAEKLRKAAVIIKKTRPVVIEDHFDDCGTDLSGLGPDIHLFAADILPEDLDDPDIDVHLTTDFPIYWLLGSEVENHAFHQL